MTYERAKIELAEYRDAAYERLHALCGTRADAPNWADIACLLREREELKRHAALAATPAVIEVKIKYWWDNKSFFVSINGATVSLTPEEASLLSMNAVVEQPVMGRELLEVALKHIDFDGMDPNTFTIAELRRAL
jgi:DNA-binding response OmpR family regulator